MSAADFSAFDLVLAMDEDNFRMLSGISPPEYRSRIRLFLEFAPESGTRQCAGSLLRRCDGFEYVLDLVEEASLGLLAYLQK